MIMGKTLEEELPERTQELRMRMVAHLQDLYTVPADPPW
jgi:hypothetical protein